MKGQQALFILLSICTAFAAGQITNPSFAGYNSTTSFTCVNKPSSLEVIHITDQCGTIVSPCWPANYAMEITEGFFIWNFNVSNQIAIRLTPITFETNTINGVLYFGRSVSVIVTGTNTLGVTRQHNMKGSLTNPTGGANPFTFENTGNTAVTRTGNTFEFSDTSSFFMSFFSSLEPVDQGFNISYCVDQNICAINATYCTDTNRGTCVRNGFDTYSCVCNSGFTGPSCGVDFNECTATPPPCHVNASCNNIVGSFSCMCKNGYSGNGTFCEDIDECTTGANNCSALGSVCANMPGTFTCSCSNGWTGDGTTCTDIDECLTNNGGCGSTTTSTCTNTGGSFTCGCTSGYTGAPNCIDINECATGADNCSASGSMCTNMPGTFNCSCLDGWTGDGTTCADIDECLTNNGGCGPTTTSTCINTNGSFTCGCTSGYTGAPNCTDINECDTNMDNCDVNAACMNVAPGFMCMCNGGWTGNGTTCIDIDECALAMDNCTTPSEICTDSQGSFSCPCNTPEYREMNGNCQGYYCSGNLTTQTNCTIPGFIEWPTFFDGSMQYEINQDVTWFLDFSANASVTGIKITILNIDVEIEQDYIIINDNPSYRNVTPIAIIITGMGGMIYNGTSVVGGDNYVGFDTTTNSAIVNRNYFYIHFHSDRQRPFTGFQLQYEEAMDICSSMTDPCMNGASCLSRFSGYSCENCTGYSGVNCDINIDECALMTDNCDINAMCMDTNGSYTCLCNADYTGDGLSCNPHIQVTGPFATSVYNNVTGLIEMTITFDVTSAWRNNNSYVENYNITYTDEFGTTSSVLTSSVGVPGYMSVTINVTANTNYTLGLSVGTPGPLGGSVVITFVTATVSVTSGARLPLAPTSLTALSTDVQTQLTWTKPNETLRGVATEYQIGAVRSTDSCNTFSILGSQNGCNETFYTIDQTIFGTSFIITDLIPYREYTLRIRARTTAGFGPWSTSVASFTGNICPSVRERTAGLTPCPYTSGGLLSENFPRAYPNLARMNWLFNHTGLGDIRLRIDIFVTQLDQDHFDCGYGNFPNPITPSDINVTLSGNLLNTRQPIVYKEAETGGLVWCRFETDAFVTNRGCLVISEIDIDDCVEAPCTMGGTCTDLAFDFNCACPSLWAGKVCNIPLVTVVAMCSSTSSDTITVSWTNSRPNDTNLITGYKVTYSSATVSTTVANFPVDASTQTFTGFAAYEEFTVEVEVMAVSPATFPTLSRCTGRTDESAPSAPTGVTASATVGSVNTLDVTWTQPSTINGVLTGYTVTYTSTDHMANNETVDTRSVAAAAAMTSIRITGLRTYRTYSVTVRATTGGGTGPESSPASARTNEGAPVGTVLSVTWQAGPREVNISFSAPSNLTGVFVYDITGFPTVQTNVGLTPTIGSLAPATSYTIEITARTAGGPGPAFSLVVTTNEDIPGPVPTPTFTAVTQTGMTVQWSPPSTPNGVITGYRVTWSPGSGDSGTLAATASSYSINTLSVYTQYTVTVYASTAVGENSGTSQNQRTMEGAPVEPVQNINIAAGPRGVNVTYGPPPTTTGVFTYVLQYRLATETSFSDSPDPNAIVGLLPFTQYVIRVVVSTSGGQGPISGEVTTTTAEDTPANVTINTPTTTATSILVSWNAPTMPNGVITGYRVTWSPSGGEMMLAQGVTSYNIPNLSAYTTYSITVYASTNAGENTGLVTTFRTAEGVPDPPSLVLTTNENNTVTVTITTATPLMGIVTHNELTIRQDPVECQQLQDTPGCYEVVRLLPASQSVFVTEVLPAYRMITISVRANTSAGFGSRSVPTTFRTNPGMPGSITNLVVSPISNTSIQVNFTTARPVPGPSNFTITYVDFNGNSQQIVISDNNLALSVSRVISGLTAGSIYTVTVTQTSSVGSSPVSPSSSLPRPSTPVPGAQPRVGTSTNLLGASATSAFAVPNPCLELVALFSRESGTVYAVDVVVKEEASTSTASPLVWSAVISQNPVPPYWAATIICATSQARKKRQLSANNATFIVGHDTTCNTNAERVCNGPLPSDRSFQVAYRADTNAPEGKSALTNYSPAVRTAATTGLQPGEIAAIVICSIVGFLLILLIIYFVYKRRRGAGTYEPKGGLDNDAFDDNGRQRYRVDPSVPASTAYTGTDPVPGTEERLA